MKKKAPIIILVISICVIMICAVIIGYSVISTRLAENDNIVRDDDEDDEDDEDEDDKDDDDKKHHDKEEAETQQIAADEDTEELLEGAIAALEGDEKDAVKALELFEAAAQQGNPDAQYIAGEMYLQGIGAEADMAKAADYIRQSYEKGLRRAYGIYAKMCFMGCESISQDYEKAAAIFHLLSDDDPEASYMLGLMHTFGMGVPTSYDTAASYLAKSAEQGYDGAEAFQETIASWVTGKESGGEQYIELQTAQSEVDYSGDLAEKINEYADTLAQSEEYAAFDAEKSAIEKIDISVAANITLFGKNNWLFMQNPNDGSSYHDYIGDNAFSEKEMASIAKRLTGQKEEAEAAGLEFVLLIIPNKEVIYSENMPTYIERVSETTRTDKLVEYLRNNTELEIIYPKDLYYQYKDEYQLYYQTDSHCNMQGSFVAVAELMNLKYQKNLSLEDARFDIHMNDYCGDLGVMLGRQDRYSTDRVYFLPASVAGEADRTSDSLLLIGDSFSEFLNTEFSYFFDGGVEHVMVMDYGYDYYNAQKSALSNTNANIVVWECAERYIDRLK